MRVLDFDGTIYDGESLLDFYLFTARKDPRVLGYLPIALFYAVRYRLGRVTLEQLDSAMRRVGSRYLRRLTSRPGFDMDRLVSQFWDANMHKIMDWYTPQSDDVVVTASFDLVAGEACRRLGITRCIGSTLDLESLSVGYLNFGPDKPLHFQRILGRETAIDAFYTDSAFDLPMIDLARRAYLVEHGRVRRIK